LRGSPGVNTIGFITIPTLGDTADFGDLSQGRFGEHQMLRGFMGGANPGGVNTIDYISIAKEMQLILEILTIRGGGARACADYATQEMHQTP
jgi:hypothetical protein